MPLRARRISPGLKEIFFDDDTFNYQKARTIELCAKLKPLKFTWSLHVARHHRLRHAEGHEGSRLPAADRRLRIGRSADPQEHQEGRHHRHGAALHRELQEAGPGRSTAISSSGCPAKRRESIRKTIDFAKRLDTETIQVSIAHPYPGTEFYDYAKKNDLITHRFHDRRGGPPASQRDLSRPGPRRTGGVGGAVLRRVLFPAARRLARRAQGDFRHRRAQAPYKEAREYMALRSKRKKFVADHGGRRSPPTQATSLPVLEVPKAEDRCFMLKTVVMTLVVI